MLERNPFVGLSIRWRWPSPGARLRPYRVNIEGGSFTLDECARRGFAKSKWVDRDAVGSQAFQDWRFQTSTSRVNRGCGATWELRDLTHFDPSWPSSVDTLRSTKLHFASALTERFIDVGPKWVKTAFGTLRNQQRIGRTCRSLIHACRGQHRVRLLRHPILSHGRTLQSASLRTRAISGLVLIARFAGSRRWGQFKARLYDGAAFAAGTGRCWP
jgi:hypothetical protein